jgi:hypothetical protein
MMTYDVGIKLLDLSTLFIRAAKIEVAHGF